MEEEKWLREEENAVEEEEGEERKRIGMDGRSEQVKGGQNPGKEG